MTTTRRIPAFRPLLRGTLILAFLQVTLGVAGPVGPWETLSFAVTAWAAAGWSLLSALAVLCFMAFRIRAFRNAMLGCLVLGAFLVLPTGQENVPRIFTSEFVTLTVSFAILALLGWVNFLLEPGAPIHTPARFARCSPPRCSWSVCRSSQAVSQRPTMRPRDVTARAPATASGYRTRRTGER